MLSSHRNFALLLFALSAAAYGAPQCRIESASLSGAMAAEGGTAQLLLRFSSESGCFWAVSSETEWATLTGPAAGGNTERSETIPVALAANPMPEARRGTLRIYLNGILHANYPFVQSGAGAPESLAASVSSPVRSAFGASGFSPAKVNAGGPDFTMTVTGVGFEPGMFLCWGATPLSSTYVNATTITALVPASLSELAREVNLAVSQQACTGYSGYPYQVLPVITSHTPEYVTVGSPATLLTVDGKGFGPVTVVVMRYPSNGSEHVLPTTVVSSTRLTATIPAEAMTEAGNTSFWVASFPVRSDSVSFSARTDLTLLSLSPSSYSIPSSGPAPISVTFAGTGFTSDSKAQWFNSLEYTGGPLDTRFVSATELAATLPASLLGRSGGIYLFVNKPSYQSNRLAFRINNDLRILSLSPAHVSPGAASFTLTLDMQGWTEGAQVMWNETPLATTRVSATRLTAAVPASLVASASDATISVRVGYDTSPGSGFLVAVVPTDPMVTGVAPSMVPVGTTGVTITVTGANFRPGFWVLWNDVALSTTYVSTTQLTASVPNSLTVSPGIVTIRAAYPGGMALSSTTVWVQNLISSQPTISYLSPGTVAAGSPAFVLAVHGLTFSADHVVIWNGMALPTTWVSAGQLNAQVSAAQVAASGTAQVAVRTSTGTSGAFPFTITGSAGDGLTLTGLAPSSATVGSPSFTLTVAGGGFVTGSAVRWNGTPLTTVYVSSSNLTATVPAYLLASPGTAQVTVALGTQVSIPLTFTISTAVALSSLSSLSPAEADAGGPGFSLRASGSNFSSNAVVTWNGGVLPTTYVSPNVLTAQVPAANIATAGTAAIAVRQSGVLTNTLTFTVRSAAPAITFLDRSVITAGSPAFDLGVNGRRFAPTHAVQWNGSALATTYVSATRLVAHVPDSLVAHSGSGRVTVATGSDTSNAIGIQIMANPVISGLSPDAAPAGSPDITLAIVGSGFEPEALVSWNNEPVTTTYLDSRHLAAVLPATLLAQPGTGQITVVAGGVTSSAARFQVAAQADLTALQPLQAPAGGSAVVLTVSGSGFPTTATVLWNGEALPTSYVSPTEVRATIPEARLQAAGTAAITVTAPGYAPSGALLFAVVPTVHPVLSFTGEATVTDPAQPIWTLLTLNEPTPVDLAGTLEISFYPDAAAAADDYIDPTTQFLSGGRKTTFTIPAGSTSAVVEQNGWLQAGTVAGTLAVRMTGLKLGPGSALPEEPPTASFTIARREPVPSTVRLRRGPEGFAWIDVTGYSTPRDLVSATLAITLDSDGEGAEPRTVTIDLQELLTQWYDSDDGRANGGQFHLTLPLNAEYDPAHLRGVSVRLTNSTGTSEAVPARLLR